MADGSFAAGVLEGRVAALEENQKQDRQRFEAALTLLGDKVEKSMNALGRTVREEIHDEIVPLRKAIVGNGDTTGCLIARVEENETRLEAVAKRQDEMILDAGRASSFRAGLWLKVAGLVIALIAAWMGIDMTVF